MKISNESIVKASIVLVGGFIIFWVLKPKPGSSFVVTPEAAKSFSGSNGEPTAKQMKDAQTCLDAYLAAMNAGEPSMRLSELNSVLMKDYKLRCSQDKDGKVLVTDSNNNIILSN